MMDEGTIYVKGAGITFFLVFIGTWIWCVSEYGFLLGVGLGWLPSAITAVFAALVWPLIACVIVVGIVFLMR
jgi:hypothetical protein